MYFESYLDSSTEINFIFMLCGTERSSVCVCVCMLLKLLLYFRIVVAVVVVIFATQKRNVKIRKPKYSNYVHSIDIFTTLKSDWKYWFSDMFLFHSISFHFHFFLFGFGVQCTVLLLFLLLRFFMHSFFNNFSYTTFVLQSFCKEFFILLNRER